MKKIFLSIILTSGFALTTLAQSVVEKPRSDSPETVSELKTDNSDHSGQTVTKGVTQHGPNDTNPVRTDRKPVKATQIRSKTINVSEPENSDVDVAQPQ